MKYKGENRKILNRQILVIPRPKEKIPRTNNGEPVKNGKGEVVYDEIDRNFIFEAQAVSDYSEFYKLVKQPEPTYKQEPGKPMQEDRDAPEYIEKMKVYNRMFSDYTIIKSLEATSDLEWEKVKLSDPSTWNLWSEELRDSGILDVEIFRVVQVVNKANGLDDKVYDEALENFLASARLQQLAQ